MEFHKRFGRAAKGGGGAWIQPAIHLGGKFYRWVRWRAHLASPLVKIAPKLEEDE
jgi:hypothetical protein